MVSIGDIVDDKYVVVARLGSGGFGEVYVAEDSAIPGHQVALKVLTSSPGGNHDDLIWEMRALAKLDRPGIVRFFHHFTHEGYRVLVMEYCAGGSLDDRLGASGALPQNEVFRYAVVLCDTLAFVHGKGIVHHDIKPANILFSRDGEIKLGDFGVANRNAGTRCYMSPEMLERGGAAKTDPRVDVYALGMTLLEMLTGVHPFDALTHDDAQRARVAQDFLPANLPRWVQELLLKATHPTPELRFQTMVDFREAIEGRHVPYLFDANRIKAHALAEKSEALSARKKWKEAEKLADHGLKLSPDCAPALVAAGRCQLLIRRLDKAKVFFGRALRVSPRTHVQKELGWLNLEEGQLPMAISLLGDHLDRNAADFEAFNLMLKCLFLSGRYEAGDDLARDLMAQKNSNDCFQNNQFLCRLLSRGYSEERLQSIEVDPARYPFLAYNLAVAREKPGSWAEDRGPQLRDKLVFQEFRFSQALKAAKRNTLSIRLPDGSRHESTAPLVTIGSLAANEVVLNTRSVSRRHALVVNLPDEVWLYDLGSTCGTRCDGEALAGRTFLDGVHRVDIDCVSLEIGSRADLLV